MSIFSDLFKKSNNKKLSDEKLSAIFNRFVGAQLPIVEKIYYGDGMFGDHSDDEGTTYLSLGNANDPTLKAINKVSKENGVHVCVTTSCTDLTPDHKAFRPNRVRAHVEKDGDGKYRIKHFDLG